jgi:hypothetical protein
MHHFCGSARPIAHTLIERVPWARHSNEDNDTKPSPKCWQAGVVRTDRAPVLRSSCLGWGIAWPLIQLTNMYLGGRGMSGIVYPLPNSITWMLHWPPIAATQRNELRILL